MDVIRIKELKSDIKTVKIDIEIWKKLAQYKLDYDCKTFQDAILKLLEHDSY